MVQADESSERLERALPAPARHWRTATIRHFGVASRAMAPSPSARSSRVLAELEPGGRHSGVHPRRPHQLWDPATGCATRSYFPEAVAAELAPACSPRAARLTIGDPLRAAPRRPPAEAARPALPAARGAGGEPRQVPVRPCTAQRLRRTSSRTLDLSRLKSPVKLQALRYSAVRCARAGDGREIYDRHLHHQALRALANRLAATTRCSEPLHPRGPRWTL